MPRTRDNDKQVHPGDNVTSSDARAEDANVAGSSAVATDDREAAPQQSPPPPPAPTTTTTTTTADTAPTSEGHERPEAALSAEATSGRGTTTSTALPSAHSPASTETSFQSSAEDVPAAAAAATATSTSGRDDIDVVKEKHAFLDSLVNCQPVSSETRSVDAGINCVENIYSVVKKLHRPSSSSSIILKVRSRDVSSMATKADQSATNLKGLTCAVCLEIYNNPKFLPCHHTYCARCIEDLAQRRANKSFRCPSCRKEVILPAGGVNALQHNFYIKPEDLEKAARGVKDMSKCKVHTQQDLDMYCIQCEQVVCFKCVLTKHKEHALQDLTEAAEEASEELKDAKQRLEEIVMQVTNHVEKQKREQHDLEEKIAAVKRNLQNRHDTIVLAAHLYLEDRMQQVDRLMDHVHSQVKEDAAFAQSYLNALCHLQTSIDTAIETKARVELVEADRDMRVGFGCRQAVDELLTQRRTTLSRPVLHFGRYTGDTLRALEHFFGVVVVMELPAEDSKVTVVEKFCCRDTIDTEVFSICPKDNDTLSLSYERRNLQDQVPSEGVDSKGKHQYTRKEAVGKATWKSRGKGKGVFVGQLPGHMRTYCKGQNTEVFLRLDNHLGCHAEVKKESIITESPYKSKLSKECSIKCGPHRAFDVDPTHNVFAVVEEGSSLESFRKVLLFHKHHEEPVAVLEPPLPTCQPTDVCFYSLDGERVLLVADEMNDAIYVVDYLKGTLTFLRYLAAGNPLVVQPTALNIDVKNRLWVACRGGSVLMVEQESSAVD